MEHFPHESVGRSVSGNAGSVAGGHKSVGRRARRFGEQGDLSPELAALSSPVFDSFE
jgi:hypothetical protein